MSRFFVVVSFVTAAGLIVVARQRPARIEAGPPVAEQAAVKLAAPLPGKLPRAVVDETKVDAGEITRGKTATFEFVVKNTGVGPLEIIARPHCGCTVVDHDKVISPGGEGRVKTSLATRNLQGPTTKSVDLETNDPDHPKFQLVMAVNVVPTIDILPGRNLSIALNRDVPTVEEFSLRPRAGENVQVTAVKCNVPYAQAALEKSPDEDGAGGYRVTVTVQPEAPLGRSSFVVTVLTTAELEPQITITARCEKGISITPTALHLRAPRANGPAPATQSVSLSKRDGTFQITSAVSSDPNLEVRTETIKEGTAYRVTVTCAGDMPEAGSRGTVTVETDDPAQPKIEIPVITARVPAGRAAKPAPAQPSQTAQPAR